MPEAPAEVTEEGAMFDKAGLPLKFSVVGSTDCGSAIFYPYAIPKLFNRFVSVTGVNRLTSTLVGGV